MVKVFGKPHGNVFIVNPKDCRIKYALSLLDTVQKQWLLVTSQTFTLPLVKRT